MRQVKGLEMVEDEVTAEPLRQMERQIHDRREEQSNEESKMRAGPTVL